MGDCGARDRHLDGRRLADGYPDPKTGVNTAISSAVTVKFAQVFARHPPEANTIVTKN
jgi:hypothetical protein